MQRQRSTPELMALVPEIMTFGLLSVLRADEIGTDPAQTSDPKRSRLYHV
jgi:hypothetical protein